MQTGGRGVEIEIRRARLATGRPSQRINVYRAGRSNESIPAVSTCLQAGSRMNSLYRALVPRDAAARDTPAVPAPGRVAQHDAEASSRSSCKLQVRDFAARAVGRMDVRTVGKMKRGESRRCEEDQRRRHRFAFVHD